MRSMKFSRSAGSCRRPSSSTGRSGNRSHELARDQRPTPSSAPAALVVVDLDALHAAARGLALKMNPQSPSFSSSVEPPRGPGRIRPCGRCLRVDSDQPRSAGSPTSRIASRRAGSPHSTSGQTGTKSTYCPSGRARNRSSLWPPSYRTGRAQEAALDAELDLVFHLRTGIGVVNIVRHKKRKKKRIFMPGCLI